MKQFNLLKSEIDLKFKEILKREISNPKILEMFDYVLDGGKRLRPILFYCILDSAPDNTYKEFIYEMCLSLELLHTISLVLDDLPCMDNDTIRRGKDAFHIKFGERQANLFVGYGWYICIKLIRNNIFKNNEFFDKNAEVTKRILSVIYKNMGMLGACTGQFLDLCPIMPGINKKEFIDTYSSKEGLMEILNLKTTTIFKLCMLCGFILGNYEFNESIIDEMSYNYGLAFQIFDDFDDITQDTIRKAEGYFTPNFILSYGLNEAYLIFNNSINKFRDIYHKHIGKNIIIDEITIYLSTSVQKHYLEMNTETS